MGKSAIKWFFHLAQERELISVPTARSMLSRLPSDADLLAVAQSILDKGVSGDLAGVQRCANDALKESRGGKELPAESPVMPRPRSASAHGGSDLANAEIPDFAGIEFMDGSHVRKVMHLLLGIARARGCSDLHLSGGAPPFWRRYGELEMLSNEPLSDVAALQLNDVLIEEEQRLRFNDTGDLNAAIELPDGGRYRMNLIQHKAGVNGTYHIVPPCPESLEELGFTNYARIEKLLDNHNGLILVTGPAGSGKTTTLAGLVQTLNSTRMAHIITIEDPIEIVYPSGTCFITQREVGRHTETYASALKGALREDPDIIVLGELHNLETIEMAVTASETGHLVIGTLHTRDAASTLNCLLGVFPPSQQGQIRAMVSENLRGIVSQQFLPGKDGEEVLASELLLNNTAVGNLIRDGKTHHLGGIMQTGVKQGMRSMDQCILELFQMDKVSEEVAIANIHSRENVTKLKRWKQEQAEKAAALAAAAENEMAEKVRKGSGKMVRGSSKRK